MMNNKSGAYYEVADELLDQIKGHSLDIELDRDSVYEFLISVAGDDDIYLMRRYVGKMLSKLLSKTELATIISTVPNYADEHKMRLFKTWISDDNSRIRASIFECMELYDLIYKRDVDSANGFVSRLEYLPRYEVVRKEDLLDLITLLKEIEDVDIPKEKIRIVASNISSRNVGTIRLFLLGEFSDRNYYSVFSILTCLEELEILNKTDDKRIVEIINLMMKYEYVNDIEPYFLEELFDLEEIRFVEFTLKNFNGSVEYWMCNINTITNFLSEVGSILSNEEIDTVVSMLNSKKR